jgi:CPA2 family monovalent cation:H+ antiporter-2
MPLSSQVIADLAVIMVIAAAVTFIFHRLKQPLILGYLIAGIIIGPYTPPFSLVSRPDVLGATADLGVILLLFAIGLEFPIARLRTIRLKVYAGISAIEIALMFLISYGMGWFLGWSFMDSLFLGAALASSSTVIIAKVLRDMGKLKDISALVMMGVLVAEDLIVVAMLAVITSVVGASSSSFLDISWTLGKVLLFLIGASLIGVMVIPKVIDWVAHTERDSHVEHDEVLLLTALGLCFALSIIGNALGLSMAIGAFLMGVFIASAKASARIATLISSIKDMFAAIFFVSMGAFIDVTQFQTFLIPALLVTAIMIAGKVIGCGLGTRLFGYDTSTSLKVGLGMGQVGEFAFIVAKAGQDLNVTSASLFSTIGVAVAITAFVSPYMIRLSYRIDPSRLPAALKRFLR